MLGLYLLLELASTMPKQTISPTAIKILTLLNNISELIVKSQKRQDAKDVMRALIVYADNKNFKIPQTKIDHFYAVLLDSRPYTLSSLLMDIAEEVVKIDRTQNEKK